MEYSSLRQYFISVGSGGRKQRYVGNCTSHMDIQTISGISQIVPLDEIQFFDEDRMHLD
jgi:hypothetical protein